MGDGEVQSFYPVQISLIYFVLAAWFVRFRRASKKLPQQRDRGVQHTLAGNTELAALYLKFPAKIWVHDCEENKSGLFPDVLHYAFQLLGTAYQRVEMILNINAL